MSAEERSINVAMSRDEAYDFLKELAEDDDLRARVEADPGAELANRGIRIDSELLPSRARLASKEEIADVLATMGDDPRNKLGRPKGETYTFHLLGMVFRFGALPFLERGAKPDGAL